MSKSVIIFGSARSNGHTRKAVDLALLGHEHKFVDLSNLVIEPFDYEQNNLDDDFIPLMKNILEYDQIFLATPIYWYAPSTRMKIFLDRWSDVIKEPHKKIGKALRGKRVFVISSNGVSPSKCFEEIFEQTCEYLRMRYMGCYNYHSGDDKQQILQSKQNLIKFRQKITG